MSINSVDDFLNHGKREGGFFNKWKKPVEKKGGGGKAKVWLHPKCLPIALWQHGFPRLVVRENKKTGETERNVWGGSFVCHENEQVLKNQYKRDEDGNRRYPPKHCPMCKLIETVRMMVDDGKLSWVEPVFRFEGDDDVSILHAGGLYNAFGRDDLTMEEKAEMKAAKIRVGGEQGAWRENAQAKMSYLFVVVDNASPDAGAQVAIETGLLGDKVKTVIHDTLAQWEGSDTPENGDPFKKPYCIQWEYRPDEVEFQKKYHAVAMPMVKLTGGVLKALKAPPPDVSETISPFNKDSMRATLERHCLIKDMPWDDIFDVEESPKRAVEGVAEYEDPDAPGEEEAEESEEQEQVEKPKLKKGKAPPAPQSSVSEIQADEDEDGLIECDACHEGIPEDEASKCPHCGQEYDEKGNMLEKTAAPPPATKKRGKSAGQGRIPF